MTQFNSPIARASALVAALAATSDTVNSQDYYRPPANNGGYTTPHREPAIDIFKSFPRTEPATDSYHQPVAQLQELQAPKMTHVLSPADDPYYRPPQAVAAAPETLRETSYHTSNPSPHEGATSNDVTVHDFSAAVWTICQGVYSCLQWGGGAVGFAGGVLAYAAVCRVADSFSKWWMNGNRDRAQLSRYPLVESDRNQSYR